MAKCKFKLLEEILKEKTKDGRIYSQGRVYLFWSILAYYLTLAVITVKSMKPDANIDIEPLKLIIDALQWCLGILLGYTFGGKGLEAMKLIMGKKADNKSSEQPDPASAG